MNNQYQLHLTESEKKYLPKGVTPQANAWSAFIASEVKTLTATNHDQFLLYGYTLLDKESFNKINDTEHDHVHGVVCTYGPFSSKQAVYDFISEYPIDKWPGDNDWRIAHVGQPFILSSFYNVADAEIVHNKSLPFQGQLGVLEMQKRIEEMETVEKKLKEAEKKPEKLTKEDIAIRISWANEKYENSKKNLDELSKHLQWLKDTFNKQFPDHDYTKVLKSISNPNNQPPTVESESVKE